MKFQGTPSGAIRSDICGQRKERTEETRLPVVLVAALLRRLKEKIITHTVLTTRVAVIAEGAAMQLRVSTPANSFFHSSPLFKGIY